MEATLYSRPTCAQNALFRCGTVVLAASGFLSIGACGEITCPEPLSLVDGSCQKVEPEPEGKPEHEPELKPGVEWCDGIDNDGDQAIDEDWPMLGQSCGENEGIGECVAGEYVCAGHRRGVVCDGATGPSAEICDGKDNDCDGLVDEGVLSVKSEVFADRATVAEVDGGFVVTRIISDQLRVETYDSQGNRTGHHDDIDKPVDAVSFIESDASASRVLVALGKLTFHVLDIDVDSELVPIVLESRALHRDWRQSIDWGVYDPPYHPRVVASPSRFLGYQDLLTFALIPFAEHDLSGLGDAPATAIEVPLYSPFDAVGPFVVWQESGNLRAGWLLDDGTLVLDIDVDRGDTPAISIGNGGPGVAYLQEGTLRLSELGGLTLQCAPERFCHAPLEAEGLAAQQAGPTALAYDGPADTWFVAAGRELLAVGRGEDGPVIRQVEVLDAIGEAPHRIDVAASGGTAAVIQTSESGSSALTFLGCF